MQSSHRPLLADALRLGRAERVRALRALAWLVAAHAAVRFLPFATTTRWIGRVPAAAPGRLPLTATECGTAMRRAGRLFPTARCLAHAAAASCLLKRSGRNPTLRLGVGFDDERRFEAHAWLECDGVIVTGDDVAAVYTPLPVSTSRHA